jgi:hypothetical protein
MSTLKSFNQASGNIPLRFVFTFVQLSNNLKNERLNYDLSIRVHDILLNVVLIFWQKETQENPNGAHLKYTSKYANK